MNAIPPYRHLDSFRLFQGRVSTVRRNKIKNFFFREGVCVLITFITFNNNNQKFIFIFVNNLKKIKI